MVIPIHFLRVPISNLLDHWVEFVEKERQEIVKCDLLVVDFANRTFLEPDDLVMLSCLIELYYQAGNRNIKFHIIAQSLANHLNNIKFEKYWTDNFKRERFTAPTNRTSIPPWKISQEMITDYTNTSKVYFENLILSYEQKASKLNAKKEHYAEKKDLIGFSSNITEVFNNIFDHSRSPVSGYILTQYYPASKLLCFSICDFGIGIPESIRRSDMVDFEFEYDWEAIIKSFELRFSVKTQPHNRGLGLNNVLSLAQKCNGKLIVTSNRGVVTVQENKYKVYQLNEPFNGTLIKVEVNINELPDKEESEEIYEF